MKKISDWVVLGLIFFLATSVYVVLVSDIGIKNENLTPESKNQIAQFELYQEYEKKYSLNNEKKEVNFSFTGYENVDPYEKENAQSTGFSLWFLNIGDQFQAAPVFLALALPWFDFSAMEIFFGLIFGALGIFFALAIWNLKKNGDN